MRIEIDTHTHTVLSGHAHSTILENAHYASQAGIKGFVATEHGPNLAGAPPEFNIGSYCCIPEKIEGVRIYRGIESNIMDFKGSIDISENFLRKLDFVIASLHEVVIRPGTMEENTQAFIGALQNPHVDIIGHAGNPAYPIDAVRVVKEAKRQNKLMEINNQSFIYRKGSKVNCVKILNLCKAYGVRISVSSDAHICFSVGDFRYAMAEVEKAGFPEELIVNRTVESFESYLQERKERIQSGVILCAARAVQE